MRKLLNFAQDFSLVKKKTTEYTNKQIQTYSVNEDLLDICNVSELEATNYNNVMDTVYNNRFGDDDDDYDSENDSFASAAESVDLEVCFCFNFVLECKCTIKKLRSYHSLLFFIL